MHRAATLLARITTAVFLLSPAAATGRDDLLTPASVGEAQFARYGIAEKLRKNEFARLTIGKRDVYFYQRMIGEAVVGGDYLNFQFDEATGELLKEKIHWRDDMEEALPPDLLTSEEAEFFAEFETRGRVLSSFLCYIPADAPAFPLDSTTENPC